MTIGKKVYKSSMQSVYKGTNDAITVKGLRTICIDDNRFTAELPDNTILEGTLTFNLQNGDTTVYMTDQGCPFAISKDNILINLYATNDSAYNFLLDAD